MERITISLALDTKAVARGERYSELHSTSLSQLVSDFLSGLPLQEEEHELTPTVRRLMGIASGETDEADYDAYRLEKYGGR